MFEAKNTTPRSSQESPATSCLVSNNNLWHFGLSDCRVYNIDDWLGGETESLKVLSAPELIALQSAVNLIGRFVPGNRRILSPLTKGIHYRKNGDGLVALPGLISVASDSHPLVVAERLLIADAENLVRSASLVLSLTTSPLKPQQLFGVKEPTQELGTIMKMLAQAKVCTLHACLSSQGHRYAATSAFKARREEQLQALHRHTELVKHQCALSAFGLRALDAAIEHQTWSDSILPMAFSIDRPVSPKRILLINTDTADTTYSFITQQTFAQLGYARRHTIDSVGPHPTQSGTDIPVEMGLMEAPIVLTRGETHHCESLDLQELKPILTRLLKTYRYDAIVGILRLETLNFLLSQTEQDLSKTPIILYDRHLHNDLEDAQAVANLKPKLMTHTIQVMAMREPAGKAHIRSLRENAGIKREQVQERLWGVSEAFFVDMKSKNRLRYTIPPKKANHLYLFSGGNSLREYSGLLEASKDLDVEIRIATSTPIEEALPNVTSLGRVFLHEFRNEIRHCDAVVLPLGRATKGDGTGYEAVGLTVIAMACSLGKPIICTRTSFAEEYVEHETSGLMFERGSPEGLNTAIRRLISEPDLLERLARGSRQRAYSAESFCDEILQRIESPTPILQPLTETVSRPEISTKSVLILHENQNKPWDQARLDEVYDAMQGEQGIECCMLEMSQKTDYSSAIKAFKTLSPDLVLLDKMPTAAGFLLACREEGLHLPAHITITDYHMLGRVDMLQEEFNRDGARHQLGEWWPSPSIEIISSYPSYRFLYERSGVPFESIRWLPIPAVENRLMNGAAPSQCKNIIAGGRHLRDVDLMAKVLPRLPEHIRHQIHYYGQEPDISWAQCGIQYTPDIQFAHYFEALRNARFIISPLVEEPYSFGGVSLLDLARSAGKPIITTDLPVIRQALGTNHAILVPPGDEAALEKAIIRCVEDDEYVDELAAKSQALRPSNSTSWLSATLINLAKQA